MIKICTKPNYVALNHSVISAKTGKPHVHFLGAKKDFDQYKSTDNFEIVTVPCGQCIECRLQRSRDWANRVMLETKYHAFSWFVTLTYDDAKLPFYGDELPTLWRPDFTKFMKDLREYMRTHYDITGIRFYMCGEYGALNHRPHWHVILFGCPIPDLKPWFKNQLGHQIYTSELIESIWKNGIVGIGEVTWDSAAYTARYILKKQTGKNSKYYEDLHIMPEMTGMSNRPGIGRQYYDEHAQDVYFNKSGSLKDEINMYGLKGAAGAKGIARPPKYYDRLFDLDSPEALAAIKASRKKKMQASEALTKESCRKRGITFQENNAIIERKFARKEKSLPRNIDF